MAVVARCCAGSRGGNTYQSIYTEKSLSLVELSFHHSFVSKTEQSEQVEAAKYFQVAWYHCSVSASDTVVAKSSTFKYSSGDPSVVAFV
jgi:hypothetical protein